MFQEFVNNILPSIEHVRVLGYWIAFFSALLETTVGIGLILPGSTIVLLLGALSARGYLDVIDLVWFAVSGAILGDNINYFLGRKFGAGWLRDGFWIIKADHIGKARQFMERHGAKSIFLGRFIPSGKEVIPLIAGSVKMNRKTFMVWNVLGAVGWGFQYVLAGYVFGQSLNLATLWLSRAGLFFAFLVLFSGILYFLKWLILKKGQRFAIIVRSLGQSIKEAVSTNEHVLRWKHRYPRTFSFFRARFDTTVFSGLPLSVSALAFIYVLILFTGIVEDLITSDPIVAADIRIANLVPSFRSDSLTETFTWITLLGTGRVVLVFIAVTVVLLWLWRKPHLIVPLLTAVLGSLTCSYLGKLAFHRPRPETALYVESSFSFPSGHATIAVAFYGFAAYLLMRVSRSWNGSVNIFFAAFLLVLAIGLSRLYLGEHYLSDIWSGYLVGAMWLVIAVSFSEWLSRKAERRQVRSPVTGARPISLLLVLIAVLFYAGFSLLYHRPLAPKPVRNVAVVSKSTDIFTREQMKYTETLLGNTQEPINVIFIAENDKQLIAAVRQSGWIMNDTANLGSFIKAVTSSILRTAYASAPISPSFWNATIQDMSFSKASSPHWLSEAHHIKIWRTGFSLAQGPVVYVGMVNANVGFKWGIIPKINPDLDTEREMFYQDIDRGGSMKSSEKIQLVHPQTGTNFLGDRFYTDGKAYILSF